MSSYTGGNACVHNFDELDIERSNAEEYLEKQVKSKHTPEERHLLKNCIVELDDGRHGYVFSYEEDARGVGSYYCHVCQTQLFGWTVVNQHISGKKHSTAIQKSYHPLYNFSRIVEEETTVELQPGEPAPPGMEDMVEPKKCIIQAKLDAFKTKPLIGLEYLIEMLVEDTDPNYFCLLCNKQGVNNNIIMHLSSQIHYMKYLQKYFSNVYSALMLVPKTSEFKKGYSVVLTRIISRIENKFGRLKPRQCDTEAFHLGKKFELLKIIDGEFHFRETIEDDYVNMVDWTEIKRLQFSNEDEIALPESTVIENPKPSAVEKEKSSKSLFNKTGRINVEKRQLRKDRESLDEEPTNKDREKSPDVIIVGEMKKAPGASKANETDRKSLSSISTASSESDHKQQRRRYSRSRSRSRSKLLKERRQRSPIVRSRYQRYSRSRSRTRSPSSRRRYPTNYRRRSRSRSLSRGRHYRKRSRSRSSSRPKPQRQRRDHSPALPYPRRRRSVSKSRSRSPASRAHIMPRYLRFHPKRPYNVPIKEDKSSQKYKWEKFREELKEFCKELDEKQKFYEKNPEKHPQYPEEWKMFWNRRYKELQSEGKDPSKYDFKPEWIIFWNKRMKEIYEEEGKLGKEKIKQQIGLQDEEKKKVDIEENVQVEKKNDVTVDDIKNTWKALTGSDIKEAKSPTSSIVEEVETLSDDIFEMRHSQSHLPARLPPPGARQGFIPYDDNAPRVISALRLISVIEGQLGSLGPRVLNLLSKALAMEKVCKGSSQDILCDEEHCVLFETIKEKLKGMLYAGLVDRNYVNLTKVCLTNIEDLFSMAPKVFKKSKPSILSSGVGGISAPTLTSQMGLSQPTNSDVVTVPGVGTIDRVAIAQQIAGALIAQGKTDVTEEELEQLITAVVGMAQASSGFSAPLTTAEYIQRAQSMVSDGSNNTNNPSGGLKLLQSAYNDADRKSNFESNIEPTLTNPSIENTTGLLNSSNELEDNDLIGLAQNFEKLTPSEQSKLISYIKKVDSTDPLRINILKKSIDLKKILGSEASKLSCFQSESQLSPFSARAGAQNPIEGDHSVLDKHEDDSDDDDDDYSVEDVYKAASEKLRLQELSREKKSIESILADIVETVKKNDSSSKITGSLHIPEKNALSSKVEDCESHREIIQDNSYRPTDNISKKYQDEHYSQTSYQYSPDERLKEERNRKYGNAYDWNPKQPYNTNSNFCSSSFPGNSQSGNRESLREHDDVRPYLDSDKRHEFPHNDRQYSYSSNPNVRNIHSSIAPNHPDRYDRGYSRDYHY